MTTPIRAKKAVCKITRFYCNYEQCPKGLAVGKRYAHWIRENAACEEIEQVFPSRSRGKQ